MKRTIRPNELKELLSRKNDILVLDVRRKTDLASFHYAIPGAEWRDPDAVDAWSADLPRDHDVVIYCARGGPVSNRCSTICGRKKSAHAISKAALPHGKQQAAPRNTGNSRRQP